jgi:hypothetical protein
MRTCTVTTSEIKEIKEALQSGIMFENESAHFFACLDKDGDSVFFQNGKYRFFKNDDAFVRAIARIIKRGW